MAKEWYLINSPHSIVSGFESEAFDYYSADGFNEAVESSIGNDIEVYNYDLSEMFEARAIVIDSVQDTKLKTLNRQLLLPIGTCHTSQIVKYKDRYWLIVGLTDDNSVYQKVVMIICNYKLSWINSSGKIISRWCNITFASQYNNGEFANNDMTVTSDQVMVLMPDDDESLMIHQGQRFVYDRRCKIFEAQFPDDIESDTSNYVNVYKLTRSDTAFFDYQTEGHHEVMLSKTEKSEKDGYYVVDGVGYWLCAEPPEEEEDPPEPTILSSEILYDTLELQNGLDPAVFTARFYDYRAKDTTDTINYQWQINCDFKDQLEVEYLNHSILISVDDWKLSNKTFDLSLVAPDYTTQTVTVTITPF